MLLDRLHLVQGGISWLGDPQLALPSVIAVQVWGGIPFFIIVLLSSLKAVDKELYAAAAQMDGCNRLTAFFRVVLPLVKPALMATALFAVTASWNEFLFAYAFIFSDTSKTLPVGLAQMVFGDVYPYGNMMAASLMMTIPVALMYTLGQRYMVEGLTAGSVKGGG